MVLLSGSLAVPCAWSQLVPGSMNVNWDAGSPDCARNPQPPLQVHPYNPKTFIIRENPCSTFEAPFIYLLIGSKRALLIDSGDVTDPTKMPLAATVMRLLPGPVGKFPLLVVHTHRHHDHRAGDAQFRAYSNADVTGFDLVSVQRLYHFTDWPNGLAEIDLGDRTIDVMPTPGHSSTEVSFYDRNTGLFFSGDFMMPGRLLIANTSADLASAERVAGFVRNRPITFVLGGHIEENTAGRLYGFRSHYRPHQHVLQMTKADLLALPDAIRSFNGVYTVHGKFTMENQIYTLVVFPLLVLAAIIALVVFLIRYFLRRIRPLVGRGREPAEAKSK